MFGEATVLVNGSRARDGFEALADLDANQDGTIDSWDDAFSSLKIWRDANSDGITDAGELLTLTEHEIVSLNLAYRESDRVDNGNELRLVSDYTKTDGHRYEMVDVWLVTDYSIVISESEPVSTVVENSTNTDDQNYFEVSQLEFDEPYSQEAMELALDYYLEEQDTSEFSEFAGVLNVNNSNEATEIYIDDATIEIVNIATSDNEEPAVTYDSSQQTDEEAYSNLVINLLLSETSHHDELLNLEINKV